MLRNYHRRSGLARREAVAHHYRSSCFTSALHQNVLHSAQGLEVKEISSTWSREKPD